MIFSKKSVSVLLALSTALAPIAVTPAQAADTTNSVPMATYTDMAQVAPWAVEAIEQAHELGLMLGYPNGEFRPLQPVTRQEMASLLARMYPLPMVPGVDPSSIPNFPMPDFSYTDVATSSWAFAAIEQVTIQGFMTGDGNGKFRPLDTITREELAVIAHRAARLSDDADAVPQVLTDHDSISTWAMLPVYAAIREMMFHLEGNTFHPKNKATRQDVAYLIYQLYKTIQDNPLPNDPSQPVPPAEETTAPVLKVRYVTTTDRTIIGNAKSGSTVKVETANGTVLGTAEADDKDHFSLSIEPQKEGSVLRVTATTSTGESLTPVLVIVEKAKQVAVTGKVTTGYGQPSGLSGIRVVLLSEGNHVVQTTYTDHNGEYRFADVPKGEILLYAYAPKDPSSKWAASYGTQSNYQGSLQLVDINLRPQFIQGRLLNSDGTPASHVLIRAWADDGDTLDTETVTDEQGYYKIGEPFVPRSFQIEALPFTYSGDFGKQILGTFPYKDGFQTLPDLKLPPPNVTGTVRTADGKPVNRVLRFEVRDAMTDEYVTTFMTDQNGHYNIWGLTKGKTYRLADPTIDRELPVDIYSTFERYGHLTANRFTYRAPGTSLDLSLRPTNVSGTVFKSSAKTPTDVLAGTNVKILKVETPMDGVTMTSYYLSVTTDANGRFEAELEDGTYLLQADSDLGNLASSEKSRISVIGGKLRSGNTDLPLRTPLVKGVVRDKKGVPVPNALVEPSFAIGNFVHDQDKTNAKGEYALAGIPSGEWNLAVVAPLSTIGHFRTEETIRGTSGQGTLLKNFTLSGYTLPPVAPQVNPVYANDTEITGKTTPNATVTAILGSYQIGQTKALADGTFRFDWSLFTHLGITFIPLRFTTTDTTGNSSNEVEVRIQPAR